MPNQWNRAKIVNGQKQCNKCDQWKDLALFHPNKTCVGQVTGTCRLCNQTRKRDWYAANKARRQQLANARNAVSKQYWIDYFGDKCADCDQSFETCVYDFHHVGGKDVNPSKALSWKFERQVQEMMKCIMLCVNCHRLRHFRKED